MKADEVRDSLRMKWPDDEYLSIDEAPMQSDRGGRKIDRLVVSLWKSRGLALDAIEIKVSVSDWRRELKEGSKADWWWRHSNRFWVAVPVDMVEKVKAELPDGWGLLKCAPGRAAKIVVKAVRHDAEPLEWGPTVGLLRAAADAGIQALWRAERKGVEKGAADMKERFERSQPDGVAQAELDILREMVATFEKASGLQITGTWGYPDRIGAAAALVLKEHRSPGGTLDVVGPVAAVLRRQAASMERDATRIEGFAARVEELVSAPTATGGEHG